MRLIFFVVFLSISGCTDYEVDERVPCDVANPANDLQWLKEEIHLLEQADDEMTHKYFFISQATYNEQTVLIFGNCCPFCNTVIPVKNCQGELLFFRSSEHEGYIISEQVIWLSDRSECNFI